MRTDQSRLRRPGIAAAIAAVAAAGVIGGVGVAGAQQSHTIFSVEDGNVNPCFAVEKRTTCAPVDKPTITIQTGDTVVWDMTSGGVHNAAPKSSTPADAAWDGRPKQEWPKTDRWTFGKPGTYVFYCTVHDRTMEGTIIVEGEPTTTPTPTATPTRTATPTSSPSATPTFQATVPPSATPVPDDHTTTPAPGKSAKKDTVAPRLLRAKVKRVKQGAKLSFWLSENATVEVVARRGKRTVTKATFHVAAGTRSVVVRSSSLRKKGTYKFQWRAVDAMANKSNVAKKTLKVKR